LLATDLKVNQINQIFNYYEYQSLPDMVFISYNFKFSYVKDFIFMNYLKHVMFQNPGKDQKILVTGGTSGLGLELILQLLRKGYSVVATGRHQINIQESHDRFTLYTVDFGDLKQVGDITKRICSEHSLSFIVNNAGILSPPCYTATADGNEYTFQINFLAHLLMNEIILNGINDNRHIRIASVTSPVYRFAALKYNIISGPGDYNAIRAYSSSKLYLTMMFELLASRHKELNLQCFSFDPGTFSSGIYRLQKRWFRELYRIAAPFMRTPSTVAKVFVELILKENIVNGRIYDTSKRPRSVPEMDESVKKALADSCYEIIYPFM
jgi:NAD(P)-dependent dehydrogenase (short-subunit alcohol dehydrogenase family)